jgi:hypothetical protein
VSRRNSKKKTGEEQYRTPQDDQRDERYAFDDTETEHESVGPLEDATDQEDNYIDDEEEETDEESEKRNPSYRKESMSKYDTYENYELEHGAQHQVLSTSQFFIQSPI